MTVYMYVSEIASSTFGAGGSGAGAGAGATLLLQSICYSRRWLINDQHATGEYRH